MVSMVTVVAVAVMQCFYNENYDDEISPKLRQLLYVTPNSRQERLCHNETVSSVIREHDKCSYLNKATKFRHETFL